MSFLLLVAGGAVYLILGDLHSGFACVECKACGHEYMLAFPRKFRCFQMVSLKFD